MHVSAIKLTHYIQAVLRALLFQSIESRLHSLIKHMEVYQAIIISLMGLQVGTYHRHFLHFLRRKRLHRVVGYERESRFIADLWRQLGTLLRSIK